MTSENSEELAIVPPESFVAARDERVKQLKAAGDADAAAAVKAMRKPTVVQWLTAMVRHDHSDVVDELRGASRAVAAAQELAITKGERDGLREAIAHRRAAMQHLEGAVDAVFASTGRPRTGRDDVVTSIEAETTEEVAAGTFGIRDDLELPAARVPRPRQPKPDPLRERRIAKAKDALERAEAAAERARVDLAAAESAVDSARVHLSEVASDA